MTVLEFIDIAANLVVIAVFCLVVIALPASAAFKWVSERVKRCRR